VLGERTMKVLLEDRLDLIDLELGLECVGIGRQAAAVGTTTGIGKVESVEDYFIAGFTPIAFASAILLGLLGVLVWESVFGKKLGEMLLRMNSALGNAGVVLRVVLVRASHLV